MANVDVIMPQMGESITEGTIIVWLKQPGDPIEMDEPLLEIGTDKVDTEVPSPTAGIVAELRAEEGDVVDVGTVIAVIATEAEAPAEAAAPAPAAPAPAALEPVAPEPAATAPEPAPATASRGSAASGETIEVVMPQMGESITEGTVVVWLKEPGDTIELDEPLLEIGTDKVDTEVPSPAAGTVVEVLVPEGDTVNVGTPLARIATGDAVPATASPAPSSGDGTSQAAPVAPPAAPAPAAPRAMPTAPAEPAGPLPRQGSDGRFLSPLVRSIAEKEGISLSELEQLQGTGRDGRVTKQDMLSYVEHRTTAPTPTVAPAAPQPARPAAPAVRPAPSGDGSDTSDYGDRVEIVEMDRMRQIIADHMIRSRATSAHVTSFCEIDVTNLVALRERNKQAFQEREGVKLTYTPFFIQAAVQALRDHPTLNASVDGRKILLKKDYHIGMAVALGRTGLIAPVIRDAGQKNLTGLAVSAASLATRARNRDLQPDELQGGTFTVTNIGSLGSLMGTPIINQPQVGILAVGAIKKRPVVIEHPDLGDTIAIRQMMYASLSYDHRIVDGAMGSSFLQAFTAALEGLNPNETL
ncbi:MAG: 2-oxoglutarate dehydrogenase, E2 component, dihydrolipoamide succinyltransferase [Bacteroidota bacterium]